MDFFANQDAARRKTGLLVFYFVIAVILIAVSIYAAFTIAFTAVGSRTSSMRAGPGGAPPARFEFWNPERFATVGLATLTIVTLGSFFKIASLRAGGSRVAEMLGGRLVPGNTTDRLERRLVNIVEEMSLASGVAVPPVYVLDGEAGINAFAAGYNPDDAVVAVTRGTLERLNRDELQGVIAHEFSHIFNGDMRLNIRLMGVLHGILLISLIGYWIVRSVRVSSYSSRSRDSKGGGQAAVALFGFGLLVIGWIGVFFGKLIKAAVSRQREYLADASAVEFTRNPGGIGGALKKIGALSTGSRITHARAEEASHMYFGNGLRQSFLGMLATHPPLVARIQRIDPQFDGVFSEIREKESKPEKPPPLPGKKAAGKSPLPGFGGVGDAIRIPGMEAIPGPVLLALAALPEKILESVGMPAHEHIEQARRLLEAIPEPLKEAAREGFGARAVVYGLLLDPGDDAVRTRQLQGLEENADPQVVELTRELAPVIARLPAAARLPLIDLAVPGLRTLAPEQYVVFRSNVDALVEADESIDLFEYTLRHVLVRNLQAHFEGPRRKAAQVYSVRGLITECSIVLSLLARLGGAGEGDDDAAAGKALAAAIPFLGPGGDEVRLLPAAEASLEKLDHALEQIALASPKLKRSVVVAAFRCLLHDREISIEEAELFRAITAALDVPVSPLLATATTGE